MPARDGLDEYILIRRRARGVEVWLPLTPIEFQTLAWALGVCLAIAVVWLVLSPDPANPAKRRRIEPVQLALNIFSVILAPIWLALLVLVLNLIWRQANDMPPAGGQLEGHSLAFLGLFTALGALVSAPLALIRVFTTERQTRTAEQGHITERISKAVEQIGAEKSVRRPRMDANGNRLCEDGPDGKPDPRKPLRSIQKRFEAQH